MYILLNNTPPRGNHTLPAAGLGGGGYDSVRCTWSSYLIIPFLRRDSVRCGMIKLKMAMLEYDLVNFRK